MAFAMIPDCKNRGQKKPFVLSPSNISTYRGCPRKFQGQSITGEVQWRATTQKSRGTLVHSSVEKALKEGVQAVPEWVDGLNVYYVQQQIQQVRKQIASGGVVHIEHEMVIDARMRPLLEGWWDENAYLRAKADVVVIPQGNSPIEVLDIKTGKRWDDTDFQLRVEALLAHLIYKRPIINYAYWYVDSGETVDGSIDFRNGLAPVQDIISSIKKIKQSFTDNYFPAKRNKFCKWCALYKTPACGL